VEGERQSGASASTAVLGRSSYVGLRLRSETVSDTATGPQRMRLFFFLLFFCRIMKMSYDEEFVSM
jgi:hypothetical protein